MFRTIGVVGKGSSLMIRRRLFIISICKIKRQRKACVI
nr:MAG TPA: hypothetical protein [Caudoviricetes sp.]